MFELRPSQMPPANPFSTGTRETPEVRYGQKIDELAQRFIYRDEKLAIMDGTIVVTSKNPAFVTFERQRRGLEALQCLCRGIEAHEKANLYHGGAWQAALIRQSQRQHHPLKPPETLTRQEVAREFLGFPFRQQLITAETMALEQYQKLLDINKGRGAVIKLSTNIYLQDTDVEVLANDIRNRITERLTDDGERKARLAELDQQLADIIRRLTDDDWGKRFELEEIYLLRRLVHQADTGHLASVSHGTPRQDLRANRGSVDIEVTAAGDKFQFQLKTFKYGVSPQARAVQDAALERAHRNAASLETHLVVLEAEAVQGAYEASLRQGRLPTSRTDKYRALQPITDVLEEEKSDRLLTVLGLTEADLQQEKEEMDRLRTERKALEILIEEKRQARLREEEAAEKARQDYLQQEARERERIIAAEAEKAARIAQQSAEAALASQRERDAVNSAKQKRILERQQEVQREQALREAEERREQEAAKRREKAAERKNAAPGWPPKKMTGLANAPTLKKLGILAEGWEGDFATLQNAKRTFVTLFGKPKNKTVAPEESDKTNDTFEKLFPTKEALESPSSEAVEHIARLLKKPT